MDNGLKNQLLEVGLIDPASGTFTSQPNFGQDYETPPPIDSRGEQAELMNLTRPDAAPKNQDDGSKHNDNRPVTDDPDGGVQPDPNSPAGPGQVTRREETLPQNEPISPNKVGDVDDPVRQSYDAGVAKLQTDADLAFRYGQLMVNEQGERMFSDQQLAGMIGQELQNKQRELYLDSIMQKMQPVAKRAAAEKLAKEHGVEVEDIINQDSPVAMEVRAKTIAELKRDKRFVERSNNGTDVAEGSRSFNNAIPEGVANLSPHAKIYAGLLRGDR